MCTILVVDDEEAVRLVVSRMLKRLGHKVLTAAGGAEAIELLKADPGEISCVIVDLAMPGLDGQQTCAALRQIQPDMCILLASGFNEEEVARRFAGQGFDGFIQKPFSVASLEQKLDEMMKSKPA